MAWAKELGLDGRGMRFARDVRRQLEGVSGADGSGLQERRGDSSATRPGVGEHLALQACGPWMPGNSVGPIIDRVFEVIRVGQMPPNPSLAMSLTHNASCVGKHTLPCLILPIFVCRPE